MKRTRAKELLLHLPILAFLAMTLLPFIFVVNNSMRRTSEQYHSFFGAPAAVTNAVRFTWFAVSGQSDRIELRLIDDARDIRASEVTATRMSYGDAMGHCWSELIMYGRKIAQA